jgi:hypothetical protein
MYFGTYIDVHAFLIETPVHKEPKCIAAYLLPIFQATMTASVS